MERLTLREWRLIRDALDEASERSGGVEPGLPDGWEDLPIEEVTGDG